MKLINGIDLVECLLFVIYNKLPLSGDLTLASMPSAGGWKKADEDRRLHQPKSSSESTSLILAGGCDAWQHDP